MTEDKNLATNKTITGAETGGSGAGHSNVGQGSAPADPVALTAAITHLMTENAALKQQVESRQTAAQPDVLNTLAQQLAKAMAANPTPTPVDSNNRINSTQSLNTKNDMAQVDGRGLMAAQESLMAFRKERKRSISIPKSFANSVGPSLPITVNGVRISIPCDGKTYYINETHWEHAKERIAKLDALNANVTPDIQTLS